MAPDPLGYPTVKIDSKDYPLKFRQRDIVSLKKDRDIDIMQAVSGIEAIERLPEIVAAGLAHLGTVSRETVIEYMGNLDIAEYAIYSLAVIEAQKKASTQALEARTKIEEMVKPTKKPNGAVQ